jgi:ATP-dependent Lon protease
LIPKQLAAHGLAERELSFDPEAIRQITRGYTREAGVRSLDREIATIARKVARRLAEGQTEPVRITAERVVELLGRPRFVDEVAERTSRPGVATGLAWTPVGGEVLFVEASMMPGSEERLVLTGMLGDVMRESAQAAVSYVWSNAEMLGIDPKIFEGKTIHVHVPAGAIPKDGPSAGVTMATALASVFTNEPVRKNLAMTGEVTLRGRVLPIGGLKEKALAARRAGITTVIIPKLNEKDLDDIPKEIRKGMSFILAETMDDVIRTALKKKLPRLIARGKKPGRSRATH